MPSTLKRIKTSITLAFCLILCSITSASWSQVELPNQSVLKSNKVRTIQVVKQQLLALQTDSNQRPTLKTLDQAPVMWAKYWFNESGLPDSMYNYMQGVAFRKELFEYNKSKQLIRFEAIDYKGTSITKVTMTPLKNGETQYRTYTKGALKRLVIANKLNQVLYAKTITNPMIFGYDSLVYAHQLNRNTSVETYYLSDSVSHKLTQKWVGDVPDSFYQTFYQSNVEAGRMPSYSFGFKVKPDGRLFIEKTQAFPSLFQSVSYQNRFVIETTLQSKISKILVKDTLLEKSSIISQQRRALIQRHYYIFEYAYY
ncbi:MAG: hypothetical protein ACI9JN_002167 [Bacteroidia bacterium]|jgi:hypothetical protein